MTHEEREVRRLEPLRGPFSATVRVPGSKSLAARALAAAALSEGESAIRGDLGAEDIEALARGLAGLGIPLHRSEAGRASAIDGGSTGSSSAGDEIRLRGLDRGEGFPASGLVLDAGAAGLAARFLTALSALAAGPVVVDGSDRMRQRPIEPLLTALRALGCPARSLLANGCPPVEIAGGGLAGGRCRISGAESSQFVSALILAGARAREEIRIEIEGPLVSRPYVDMTIDVATAFGLRARSLPGCFAVTPGPGAARRFDVEPDASSAGYAFAAAAITGGEVIVPGLSRRSLQPDIRFLDLLENMGCSVEEIGPVQDGATAIRLRALGSLRGVRANLRELPDSVPALAAVALFAAGQTVIEGVAHLRFKESDRLAALAGELGKLGARVEERRDGLGILPGPLHGGEVDSHRDHRMAMALALVGLRVPGVRVKDPACVAKSFPGFWDEIVSR